MPRLRTAILARTSVAAMSSALIFSFSARATAAPGTFDLSSPTNGAWCTATCTFTWQQASAAASYDLYVDGALKKAAIGTAYPPTYTLAAGEAIADGLHTWHLVARDSGGTTTTSTSSYSVRVDANSPTSPVLVSPAANDWISSAAPTFTWSASSDVGSGIAGYEIWINGAAAKTGIAASTTASTASLPMTSLFSDGISSGCPGWAFSAAPSWSFVCAAENSWSLSFRGNYIGTESGTATMTNSIDLTNAGRTDLVLAHYPTSAPTLRINASDDGGTTWRTASTSVYYNDSFSLDDFTGTAAARIQFYGFTQSSNGWDILSVKVNAVTGGSYTWQVVAIDLAGNRTASESRQVRYDLPPLPFNQTNPVANSWWTANTTPTFTWNATSDAGSGVAKYQLWIDGILAVDNIAPGATSAAATNALTDGTHRWQIYAIDAAGAVRHSRNSLTVGIDTTPPNTFSLNTPADQSATGIPTPSLCWNMATDSGSGLDHYQLVIDGGLERDSIASTCSTPVASLTEGTHTWTVKAVDKVGNIRDATQTRTIYVDFGSYPTAFNLLSPTDGATVDTLTPTFMWEASADSGSGLARYELRIDGACVACSLAPTATSYTISSALTAASHSWSVTAVDHAANSTVAAGAPWTFTARVCAPDSTEACAGSPTGACDPGIRTCSASGTWSSCTGVITAVAENCGNSADDDCDGFTDCADPDCFATCTVGPEPGAEPGSEPGPEPAPEPGPEPAPEPSRDAGVDAPPDAAADGPVTTATSTGSGTGTTTTTVTTTATSTTTTGTTTATATSTSTVTTTGSATATGTTTATAGGPEPGGDAGAPVIVPDASVRDAGTDISTRDASATSDAQVVTPALDAPGVSAVDAGVGNASDAKTAGRDGPQGGSADGSGGDAVTSDTKSSGGCGCVVGGMGSGQTGIWPLLMLALLALSRARGLSSRRPRR